MSSDLIERLRAAVRNNRLVSRENTAVLFDEARAEIERLQSLLEVSRANEEELRKALSLVASEPSEPREEATCPWCGVPLSAVIA